MGNDKTQKATALVEALSKMPEQVTPQPLSGKEVLTEAIDKINELSKRYTLAQIYDFLGGEEVINLTLSGFKSCISRIRSELEEQENGTGSKRKRMRPSKKAKAPAGDNFEQKGQEAGNGSDEELPPIVVPEEKKSLLLSKGKTTNPLFKVPEGLK